ncbi:hypothetical protein P4O66_012190 [Electrophorus voltai]|uniref:Neural proliferation, differentiation and control, 1b n=1 Tax=Electrophorus voltai TaxID=2609070 RepID=A0AAD9DTJ6_9TELE|nr:hypothetical protein P4O66_012190 [Electrophorus voltai]
MRSPRRGVRSRPWASLLIEAVLIATFTTSSAMTAVWLICVCVCVCQQWASVLAALTVLGKGVISVSLAPPAVAHASYHSWRIIEGDAWSGDGATSVSIHPPAVSTPSPPPVSTATPPPVLTPSPPPSALVLQLRRNASVIYVIYNQHRHIHLAIMRAEVPELDEEIDLLSSIITKHRESGMKHTAPSQDAPGIAEDSSRLRSHHRPKATVGSAPAHPVPSALTTLTTMGAPLGPGPSAPSSPSPVASVVQGVPLIVPYPPGDHSFTVVTGLCLMLGSVALVLAAVCWVRMQRATRLAQKADYSAFGVLNHHSYDVTSSGDKTLAQSAQMYHYQHQKQQMLSLKQRDEPKIPESGATSDEENEDGDFTVYECPGLAPTGEMEVKNPLFDDSTLHLHLNLQRSYN